MINRAGETKNERVNRLFAIEKKLVGKITQFDGKTKVSPASVARHLVNLDDDILEGVAANLTHHSNSLDICSDIGADPWNDTEFLTISMSYMGLSFPQEVLRYMGPDLVVEAYDMNRRQIFRNMRFMEISNYSLLQVLTFDWPMLFHRESEITELIIKQGEKDMWSSNQVIKSCIPKHYIRELLSDEPQVCEVQQQYFAPLFSGPDMPGGGLVISAARQIGADSSVNRETLSFI